MALKPDRRHVDSQIDFFMNEVAERGGIVSFSTVGSGVAMDQSQALVTYAAAPSGVEPVGILINDMVNLDLVRQHKNFHKDEVQIGGKVTIWNQGTVVTNRIHPSATPAVNTKAYLAHSGLVSNTDLIGGNIVVGRFDSSKDEDGYAKLTVNLP